MCRIKSFFLITFLFIAFWQISMEVYALDGERQGEEKKIIYFIYDNSISMKGELPGQEQYAVQMFGAMSDPQDEISIYCVSQFKKSDRDYVYIENNEDEKPKIHLNQSDKERFFGEIRGINFDGKYTYFSSIVRAVNDIKNQSGEKWVVMFTDGLIEKGPDEVYDADNRKDVNEINNKVKDLLDGTGVNFYFSSLLDKSIIKENKNANIYIYTKKSEDSVIDCILSAAEVIYGKRKQTLADRTETGENEVRTVRFDIPVSDLILLIQNDKEEIRIEDADLLSHKLYDISAGNGDEKLSPYGFMAEFKIDQAEYLNRDDYEISFNIPSNKDYNIDIYYTPIVEPVLLVHGDADGVREGKYVEGKYNAEVEFLNPKTGLPVNKDALLLSEEECILKVDGKNIDNFNWKEGYGGIAEKGEVEFILQTSLGNPPPQIITFEKSFEDYKLELGGAEDIFYYNRLNEKEKALWAEIHENGVNITDVQMKPTVNFYQNGVENKEIKGELEFDPKMRRWNIYPVLENPQNLDISGDFICDVKIVFEADYYEAPMEYGEEIELKMGVEGALLETVFSEKISERKYSFPFIGDWIKVNYKWNDIEVEENQLEGESVAWEIYRNERLVECKEEDSGDIHIPWKVSYLWEEPDKIVIKTEAEISAYGEIWKEDGQEREIVLEGMQMWVKIICWGIIICFVAVAVICLWFLGSYLCLIFTRERRLLFHPKVTRCRDKIWISGKVRWKWKLKRKSLLWGGYYLATLGGLDFSEFQELKMRLYCRKGGFQMSVLGLSAEDIEMYIDSSKIDVKDTYIAMDKIICVCDATGNKNCKIKIE